MEDDFDLNEKMELFPALFEFIKDEMQAQANIVYINELHNDKIY